MDPITETQMYELAEKTVKTYLNEFFEKLVNELGTENKDLLLYKTQKNICQKFANKLEKNSLFKIPNVKLIAKLYDISDNPWSFSVDICDKDHFTDLNGWHRYSKADDKIVSEKLTFEYKELMNNIFKSIIFVYQQIALKNEKLFKNVKLLAENKLGRFVVYYEKPNELSVFDEVKEPEKIYFDKYIYVNVSTNQK